MAVSYNKNITRGRFVFWLPDSLAVVSSSYICDYAIKALRNLLR
jgi:hypothetical protein